MARAYLAALRADEEGRSAVAGRATAGTRITLADGRELIDGIASWWTACHGYNHPHIRAAVAAPARVMPHVMFGGLVHEPALTLARAARGAAAGRSRPRVLFAISGSVAVEVAMKMAVQYWLNQRRCAARTSFSPSRAAITATRSRTMAVCDPEEGMHALFAAFLPDNIIADLPRDEASAAALRGAARARMPTRLAGIIVEPLVQGAGGMLLP